MIAKHKSNSCILEALVAIVLTTSSSAALPGVKGTIVREKKKMAAESTAKEHVEKRTFVTIVAGADGNLVHWDGEQLEWADFRDMLGNLTDNKNTVLEVAFKPGIIPDNKNGNFDDWLDKNDVYKKAERLVRELGLERVVFAGEEDPGPHRASVSIRTEGKLVLGREIPVALKTLELRPVFEISKIEFEKRHGNLIARLRLGVRSVPRRLWDIGVRLLDEKGHQKDSAGINFENTGKVGIFPQTYRDEVEIDFGLADIQRGDTFEVRVRDIIRPKSVAGQGELRVPGDSVPTLYWTDSKSKKIQCWDANEQMIKDLVVDPAGYINDIEIDYAAKKMYWTDSYQNLIRCANLDGSDIKNIVTKGLSGPENIFFDSQTSKIYWVDWMTDKVHRANKDGSNIEDVIPDNLSIPNGVTIDADSRKLYWTDSGGKKIQVSNIDGSDIKTLPIDKLGYPRAITIDPEQRKIYWTDLYPSRIRRANLDGSGAEDIVVDISTGPCVLSLDIVDRKVYWTELGLGLIKRANLDGSDVEEVVSGLANPRGIRVYREKKKK